MNIDLVVVVVVVERWGGGVIGILWWLLGLEWIVCLINCVGE